jgi:predicted GH43/DUF377 family glycosyl hydrolase
MNHLIVCRNDLSLQPDSSRVIIRPFIPGNPQNVASILNRALALSETEVSNELEALRADFNSRHFDIESLLFHHYQKVQAQITTERLLSYNHQLLIGALFSGEYALESAALFNPSIVPHPDQSGVPEGCLRFIMSLRATGEGHISSIEFRTGMIQPNGTISVDPVSRFVTVPDIVPNPTYNKNLFITKLQEMGFGGPHADAVMNPLAGSFTLLELDESVERVRRQSDLSQDLRRSLGTFYLPSRSATVSKDIQRTLECIRWLADSNYELNFSSKLALSERIIFPVSANESNGIEDARFVRFVNDDGSAMYYATYTAYNGQAILPQWIETQDFLHFRVLTLNGKAVQNKGMALFPRKVHGKFLMLSRQDDENLLLMSSDNPHHWEDPHIIMRPAAMWESVKIGNCGSPIETEAGWLVITHGVGPMRKYCIGAALLDLNDPSRVIGRLHEPLIAPEGHEREGYVPNVVYSCGSLIHGGRLILPYAMSDRATAAISVSLNALLRKMHGS